MSRAFKPKSYKKGEFLIIQDTPAEEFYVIDNGCVHVTKSVEGKTIDIGDLESGAYLGEIGLISQANRTANAIAISDTSVFVLGKKDFSDLCGPILVRTKNKKQAKLTETMDKRKTNDTDVLKKKEDPMKSMTLGDLDTVALLGKITR